ncbi:MAG: hypothetical protein ABI855_00145 [Bacteroidota bacterium]
MAKKLKRKFHIADPEFVYQAWLISALFKEDKPDFINFDSGFSDPFYDDLVLMIKDVSETDDNETLVDVQMQLSVIVKKNMQRCRDKYMDAKHFIKKAFPNDAAMEEAFGFKSYGKVRKNSIKLEMFMNTFHGMALRYSSELIAVNYTQPMIDEIETFAKALRDSSCDHGLFIKSRSTEARHRISKMNDLYDLLMQVCKAGKRIYKNDWAMYQRYLFKHFKKERKKKLKAAA